MKFLFYNIIAIFLFFVSISNAHTYYVSPNGNDSSSGDATHPWLTIQKAANTLIANDTVYIKAGTYMPAQKIEFQNSGTQGNYIHYLAYPGDEGLVIIDGSNFTLPQWYGVFSITSKSYLHFNGLKIINSDYAGFFIENSSYIIIENNQTYQTHSSGILVNTSNNLTINNNEVRRACWPTDGMQECISIMTSNHVLVQNNTVFEGGSIGFGGGGEGIDIKDGSANCIVYNNLVHDVASVGLYVDAYMNNQSNIQVTNNTVYNIHGVGISVASEEGGELQNVIVSRNSVSNCDDRALVVHWTNKPDYVIKNIYVYHNTFVSNGEGLDIGAHSQGNNINICNNIFSQNQVYQIQNSSNDLNQNQLKIQNNLIDGINPNWALSGIDAVYGNPEFVNLTARDYHLTNISPAIDHGTFLTTTTNSGSGNTIAVSDAGFFSAGYGLKSGTQIKLEGNNQISEITTIDYSNQMITLNGSTSWYNGQGITSVYNDLKPDIGMFEFDNSQNITEFENDFLLFPNPVKQQLFIPKKLIGSDYRIIDLHGAIIKSGTIEKNSINVEYINSGIYLIHFILDHKLNLTKKIIVR